MERTSLFFPRNSPVNANNKRGKLIELFTVKPVTDCSSNPPALRFAHKRMLIFCGGQRAGRFLNALRGSRRELNWQIWALVIELSTLVFRGCERSRKNRCAKRSQSVARETCTRQRDVCKNLAQRSRKNERLEDVNQPQCLITRATAKQTEKS